MIVHPIVVPIGHPIDHGINSLGATVVFSDVVMPIPEGAEAYQINESSGETYRFETGRTDSVRTSSSSLNAPTGATVFNTPPGAKFVAVRGLSPDANFTITEVPALRLQPAVAQEFDGNARWEGTLPEPVGYPYAWLIRARTTGFSGNPYLANLADATGTESFQVLVPGNTARVVTRADGATTSATTVNQFVNDEVASVVAWQPNPDERYVSLNNDLAAQNTATRDYTLSLDKVILAASHVGTARLQAGDELLDVVLYNEVPTAQQIADFHAGGCPTEILDPLRIIGFWAGSPVDISGRGNDLTIINGGGLPAATAEPSAHKRLGYIDTASVKLSVTSDSSTANAARLPKNSNGIYLYVPTDCYYALGTDAPEPVVEDVGFFLAAGVHQGDIFTGNATHITLAHFGDVGQFDGVAYIAGLSALTEIPLLGKTNRYTTVPAIFTANLYPTAALAGIGQGENEEWENYGIRYTAALQSPEIVREVVHVARRAGFERILFNADSFRGFADDDPSNVWFANEFSPGVPDYVNPTNPNPLQYLIDYAGEYDIEVWLDVTLNKTDENNSEFRIGQPTDYVTGSHSDEWYNILNPAYRAARIAAVVDIMNRYQFPGVELDYSRYGRDINPDTEAALLADVTAAMTELLDGIEQGCRAAIPGCVITLWSDYYKRKGQGVDVGARLNAGKLDFIYSGHYGAVGEPTKIINDPVVAWGGTYGNPGSEPSPLDDMAKLVPMSSIQSKTGGELQLTPAEFRRSFIESGLYNPNVGYSFFQILRADLARLTEMEELFQDKLPANDVHHTTLDVQDLGDFLFLRNTTSQSVNSDWTPGAAVAIDEPAWADTHGLIVGPGDWVAWRELPTDATPSICMDLTVKPMFAGTDDKGSEQIIAGGASNPRTHVLDDYFKVSFDQTTSNIALEKQAAGGGVTTINTTLAYDLHDTLRIRVAVLANRFELIVDNLTQATTQTVQGADFTPFRHRFWLFVGSLLGKSSNTQSFVLNEYHAARSEEAEATMLVDNDGNTVIDYDGNALNA